MTRTSTRATLARLASAAEGGVLSLETAADALGTSRLATSRRLSALARAGWISHIRRGLYSIRPLETAPESHIAEEDPWTIATRVFSPCYIGGWSAAGHWGLTEQLYRATMIVSTRRMRASSVRVGSSAYVVATDRRTKQTGLVSVWRANVRASVSGVERTLLDACAHPEWVGGGSELIAIFRSAIEKKRVSVAAMLREAESATTGAARGRLGLLTELFWPEGEPVAAFAREHRSAGYARLDPAVKRNGRLITRWGVWLNIHLPDDRS